MKEKRYDNSVIVPLLYMKGKIRENMERFKNGSTVCFIGDSFVHQNHYLPMIISCYKKQFPESKIRFVNCGVSGGTARFANTVFEKDVLPYAPDYAVVVFGVNDSRRWELENPRSKERYAELLNAYEVYKKNLSEICEKITSNGIKLILCTPAPYDEYSDFDTEALKGGFALVAQYADFVRSLAKDKGYTLCDYHARLTELMQDERIYSDDRVHPTYHGYHRIAEHFLSLQGVELGKEEPLPEYFADWREKVRVLRNIYATECMLIPDSCVTVSEKLGYIKNYLESGSFDKEYFKVISEEYLANKLVEQRLRAEENDIYINEILN